MVPGILESPTAPPCRSDRGVSSFAPEAMDLPKLKPGQRFHLPRPAGAADALLLAQLAQRGKVAGRPIAIVTADATDALFATDNYKAGVLIGQYAKTAMAGKPVKIATLDLFPGHPVGAQRHNGFLQGFGLASNDAKNNELAKPAEVVCMADSFGDRAKGQTAMENCLQKAPDVTVVDTINEPAAADGKHALSPARARNSPQGLSLVTA